MKVTKEIQFTLTEEEICSLLISRLIEKGELPELTEDDVKTSLYYKQEQDLYTFEVRLERGAVNDT